MKYNCVNCGKEIDVRPSRINRQNGVVTCSNECKSLLMLGKPRPIEYTLPMIEAGTLYSRSDRGKKNAINNLPKNNLKERNGNWRGGLTEQNYNWRLAHSKEYNKWRKDIITRDKCCRECESKEKLEAHHIFEMSDFKDVAFELWNGVTLCRKCHQKTDSWGAHKKKVKPIGLLDCMIIIIPHKFQEYDTIGNYKRVNDVTYIMVSDMGNPWYARLVAIHELIEETMTRFKGIKEEDILNFDLENIDDDDPGHLENAPYYQEHMFALDVEKKMCEFMGLKWDEYDDATFEIWDN